MTETILPMHVDRRLITLSKELDTATTWLMDAEEGFMAAKTAHDLAARVLAWADGSTPAEIATAPQSVLWLDAAQQCLEDLGEAK